jgi:hypothetical protein
VKHTQNHRRLHLLIGGLCLLSVSSLAIQSAHAQQVAAYSGDVASYGTSAPAQSQASNAARKPIKRSTVAAAVATGPATPAPSAATSNAMASTAPTSATVSSSGDTKPAPAARKPAVSVGKGPYYVDFRARTAASYGHAFVWFGKTGERKVDVAGLHPKGDEGAYMLGHLTWVPAETGASYGDLDEQYLTANYRVYLSEADAKIVFAHIRELQATSHFWNAQTNNCTGFIGKIANFMGLKTPFHLVWPENYVKQMKEMNGGRTTVQLTAPSQASLF